MLKCDYCGRYLKKKYKKCPGCGSKNFKNEYYEDNLILEHPPQGGYTLDLKYIENQKKPINAILIFRLALTIITTSIFSFLFFVSEKISVSITIILISLFAIFCIVKTHKNEIKKINQKIENMINLAKTGLLIKNLKYIPIPVSNSSDIIKKDEYFLKVRYVSLGGKEKSITSTKIFTQKEISENGNTVDLLIDKNNTDLYYINFEIF